MPVFNVNTGGVYNPNTSLRYCDACMTWVTGYHGCQWDVSPPNAGFAAYPQSSTAIWTCGACGLLVRGAFHTCIPLTFTPAVQTQPRLSPHVCPVCSGEGKKDDAECKACKGACVLWG
jgi:hypothetical protein